MTGSSKESDAEFFPKGALAFFAALIVFFSAIWLAVYALLLHRR